MERLEKTSILCYYNTYLSYFTLGEFTLEEKFHLAREIAACLSGVEVIMLRNDDASLSSLLRDNFPASALPLVNEQNVAAYLDRLEPGCVYFLSGILGLSYIAIRLPDLHRFLFAGPCRSQDYSEARVRSSLRHYDLSTDTIRQIIGYCRWQPALSRENIHRLGIALGHLVLDLPEPVPYRQIEYNWNQTPAASVHEPEPYADHSKIRQIEMRYEASTALTEAVKQGNLSLALRMIQGIRMESPFLTRNPDPLRNAQNMCIVLNTQLRHAMEERRIHPYRLDTVSTEIARQIEMLKNQDEVLQFFSQIIRRYCELALEKNYAHLEPFSRQAVVYIKTHLTDNLSVRSTAEALLVNANYLSGKFHREVGMTFTDFVNRERTEQAASLLRHTNMQIQQIAAAVGYNNTSYFAKQFLRFFDLTPRAYRRQGAL